MPPKKAATKKVSLEKGGSETILVKKTIAKKPARSVDTPAPQKHETILLKTTIAKKPAQSVDTPAPQKHVMPEDALQLQYVFHEALIYGHRNRALAALSAGASPSKSSNGWTPLHTCATNGRDVLLRHLLEKYRAQLDLNARHPNTGETPLHRAAWGGRHDDKTDKRGQGKLECARLLIEAGALPNAVSDSGETPVDEAARWGGTGAFVEMLTKAGADLRART